MQLFQKCKDLESSLFFEEENNVCGSELFPELKVLLFRAEVETTTWILRCMSRILNPFRNASITYKIWLIIFLIVAIAKRRFPRLKLIKRYLRSSFSNVFKWIRHDSRKLVLMGILTLRWNKSEISTLRWQVSLCW